MPAFEYILPAVRGKQAGHEFFVTMCPLKTLAALFPEGEADLRPELEAHRAVNAQRVPEIVRYITNHPASYVLGALTATVDSHVRFKPARGANDGNVGHITVPMSARMILHDGLHRCAALKAAVKRIPKLAEESVSLVLFPDPGLKRSDQIFTDLKRHERKSPRSLRLLHDDRDEIARLTRQMVQQVAVFRDSIEMVRTTISNRSRRLFTLSALYQATKTLLALEKSKSFEKRLSIAIEFWDEVSKRIPDWELAVKGEVTPAELRKTFVHSHGIALAGLGRVGQALLHRHPKTWRRKLGRLRTLDWSRKNSQLWEGRAMIGGRLSKARSCVILTGNAIKLHLGLPLSSEEQELERQYAGGK
jgi:DNA sulfur modification protein DndB